MLLIDGVKYELWTPPNEDEFERVVKEHVRDIFGEKSIYLDIKQRLKSVSGIGSIWDGCAIVFGDSPQWHIIEAELSCHLTYEHIIAQIGKFIGGINNNITQKKIVDAIHDELTRDDFLRLRLRKTIEPTEIYKFLADLISTQPVITIIIEKETDELREAIKTLHYPKIKIVEFQTFTREGIGLAVHAHLFEPLHKPVVLTEPKPHPPGIPLDSMVIQVFPSYITYEYIGIWRKNRESFPQYGETIELMTDDGEIFKAEVGKSPTGSTELWYLRDWYSRNPDLKKGDTILITPVEPMKKYRIQTRRQQKEVT